MIYMIYTIVWILGVKGAKIYSILSYSGQWIYSDILRVEEDTLSSRTKGKMCHYQGEENNDQTTKPADKWY